MKHWPFSLYDRVHGHPDGPGTSHQFSMEPALRQGLRIAHQTEDLLMAIPNARIALMGGIFSARDYDFFEPQKACVWMPDSLSTRDWLVWMRFFRALGEHYDQ